MKERKNMPVKVGLKYIEIWKESMEDVVSEYEKESYEKGQIVFYGPSNFTRWGKRHGMRPMRDDLLGKSGAKCVINRGFGSSSSEHQLYYYPRMVRPLEPSVLVYSSHPNGDAFGYSNEEIWELAQRVIAYAKTDFPDLRVYLCSANARAVATDAYTQRANAYNKLLKEFCRENSDWCFYIDTFENHPELFGEDIYVADGVHFNQQGYDRYRDLFLKELEGELAKF